MKNNGNKSRIDRIRESAGMMTVGDDSDGAIVSMATIGDKLFAVKEGAIYAISLADSIDPKRMREDIPNTVQKVFEVGSNSEVVQRLLLTGMELFKKDRFHENVNFGLALNIVIEIMRDVLAASALRDEFEAVLQQVRSRQLATKQRALSLPSFPSLHSQVKSFVQKIDHMVQSVFNLICVFYDEPTLRKAGKWLDGLATHLKSEVDQKDEFAAFAKDLARLGKLIRNVRHCIEHPKTNQKLLVVDYSLNAEAVLLEPSITVIHDYTPVDIAPVQEFMRYFLDQLIGGVEILMAFLAGRHLVPLGGLQIVVGEIPPEQRRLGVRYVYLVNMGGKFARLG
jgi:hypothetical protein